jgi:RNA-binding protein YlmH
MEYKDVFLKRVSKIEDKLFLSKLLDKAIKAEDTRSVTYSDFLDPYQKSLLQKTFKVDNDIKYIFNGGYPGAEREIVVFCPNNMSIYDYPNFKYPLNLIEISSRKMENLSHRDFLGALMGLGIKREKVGDILLEEGICRVIVINEIADYIKFNLDKIGKTRVDVEIKSVDEIHVRRKGLKK